MIARLLKGSAERITFVDQAMASGGNFMLTIAMVRALGLESFGMYTALIIIYLFGLGLQQVLIHAPMMVFFPRAAVSRQLLTHFFFWQMLFIGLFLGVWWLADYALTTYMPVRMQYEFAAVLITMLVLEFMRKVNILLRRPLMVMALNTTIWLEVVLLLLMPWLPIVFTLSTFLWCMVIINTLGVVVGMVTFPFFKSTWQAWLREGRGAASYARWLLGGTLLTWFSGNYLLILAQAQFGMAALGGIRAAQAFLGPINVSLAALENAVTIQGAHLFTHQGWSAFRTYWMNRMRVASLLFFAAMAVLVVTTPWLVRHIYHITEAEIIALVRWMLLANILVILNTLFRAGFKVINKTGSVLIISLVQGAFFMVCGHWLLNAWCLNGVAVGIAVSQALSVCISTIYWYRYATAYSLSTR